MSDSSIANTLITEHIDIWTSTVKTKSASGRGSSKKIDLYGIKKLRELILELAVRGKLVPQDPSDEPASKLLERIAAEKAQLVKEKKIKKPKALPEISEEEKPFELPEGWEWDRLGNFVSIIRGITFPASAKNLQPSQGQITCLRTANVQHEIDWNDLIYVDESFIKREEQYLSLGDIVMSMANSRELVGKVSYVNKIPNNATFGGFLSVIRPYEISSAFLMLVLRTPNVKDNLIGSASQTTNIANISLEKLNPLLISVPPIAEQHRIVAKVDELMTLCDQLEQQTESQIEAQQTLVSVLLETLTASKSHNELMQNWQRLSEHFDTLFTTEQSIDQLKQTILQLAVMGRLVPQDPTDEPASKLLECIAAEKAQLIADKKIKKQKALPPISDDEKPFELPDGWEWCSMLDLGHFFGGKTPSKSNLSYWNGDIPWVTPKDMKVRFIYDSEDKITQSGLNSGLSLIENESLLFVVRSGILRRQFPVAITKVPCTVNQDLKVLSLYDKSLSEYIYLMMKGFENYILEKLTKTGTTVESLIFDSFSSHNFMLPPYQEQHRIVAKVDELMAICDQLKAKLNQSQQTQLHLTDAIVEQVV